MYRRVPRIARVALLFFCVFIIFKAHNSFAFERFLSSSSISFNDFDPDYASALIAARSENSNIPAYDYPPIPSPPPEEQHTIPPIIHFIWFQNEYTSHLDVSQIPTHGSHAPSLCAAFNPSFTIHVWNATSARALLAAHYAWLLPTYDAYRHPIQRIDALKYGLLFHHGGVYLDLDVSCRRPLDPLLAFAAWLPKAAPLGVNNDAMASRARHPLLGMMLARLAGRDADWGLPYLTVYWSTGPRFASDVLALWWGNRGEDKKEGEGQGGGDRVYVLPKAFYSEEYTFFGHSPGGTWHGRDVAAVLWLVDRPWVFVVAPGVVFAVLVGVLRARRWMRVGHRGGNKRKGLLAAVVWGRI